MAVRKPLIGYGFRCRLRVRMAQATAHSAGTLMMLAGWLIQRLAQLRSSIQVCSP